MIRMPGKSFRRSGILFILLGLLALSGCWDVEEINRRSLTDTIFFDIGKSKRFKIGVVDSRHRNPLLLSALPSSLRNGIM